MAESNCQLIITRDLLYHLTKGAVLERVARIELANNPWQGFRLPLHHTRIRNIQRPQLIQIYIYCSVLCPVYAIDLLDRSTN